MNMVRFNRIVVGFMYMFNVYVVIDIMGFGILGYV